MNDAEREQEDAAQEEWLRRWNEQQKEKINEKRKARNRKAKMRRNRIWFFGKKRK